MKTNFKHDTKLVLVDDQGKVIAIIAVEKGEQTITDRVCLAIKEDMTAEEVYISPELDLTGNRFDTTPLYFDAEVIEKGSDNNVYDFKLIPTQDY
jgi:hypothetical protein